MNKYLRYIGMPLVVLFVFLGSKRFGDASACCKVVDKDTCEKIGQMLIIGFGGFDQDAQGKIFWNDVDGTKFNKNSLIAKHIAHDHIGGVILFTKPARDIKTGEFIRDRNIQNPAQLAKLNQELQDYNTKMREKSGLEHLPIFISVDQEGGRIDRMPAIQGFPVSTLMPQAFGAKEEATAHFPNVDRENAVRETYDYASKLATEISDAHFNLNFFPTVDVNINPTNPIIGGLGRSFSSDPSVVVNQAKQFIRAFHEHNIITTLKHFPGHGSSTGDTHEGLVDVTATYKKAEELAPYYDLIKDGYADIVMTTHVINGNIDKSQCKAGLESDPATWCPGTMSQKTLADLLRNDMGFKGIIISDDMTMGAITKQYSLREVLKKAVNAGVDMFIVANNKSDLTEEVIVTLAELVKSGDVKKERIDDAYKRIVKFKKTKL